MNMLECQKELLVTEALRREDWSDELRNHVAACSVCADTVLTAQLLKELNDIANPQVKLPNAGLIWWKAQLKAKRAAAERAAQPIRLVEKISCACAALAALFLSIWQWNAIRLWLGSFASGFYVESDSIQDLLASAWGKSSPILILSATALAVLISFVGYLAWKED